MYPSVNVMLNSSGGGRGARDISMQRRCGGKNCNCKVMVKVKFTLEQATKAQRESRGISTLPLTSVLTGVDGERHAQAPGKDPVPIVQEAGWAPGPVWTGAENLTPTGILSPDSPAHSESLYRLSYPGPHCNWKRE